MLQQLWTTQKLYGKSIEDFESYLGFFFMVLEDQDLTDISQALKIYCQENADIPTGADIIAIIKRDDFISPIINSKNDFSPDDFGVSFGKYKSWFSQLEIEIEEGIATIKSTLFIKDQFLGDKENLLQYLMKGLKNVKQIVWNGEKYEVFKDNNLFYLKEVKND